MNFCEKHDTVHDICSYCHDIEMNDLENNLANTKALLEVIKDNLESMLKDCRDGDDGHYIGIYQGSIERMIAACRRGIK